MAPDPHRHRRRNRRWPVLGLGAGGIAVAAAVVALAVGMSQAVGTRACAAVLPAGEVSGIATHYVLQGLPNCSYPSPPADGLLVNPSLPGPISLLVKQGSSPYWLALLAMNTGNPLASVQVRSESGGGWYSLVRASYNYWVARSGAGPGPFTVRLTDTQGQVVTVQGIALSPGVVQGTGTWMYGAGTTTGPAPEPAGTTPPAPRTSRPVASATSGRALASRAAGELAAGPGTPCPTSPPSATPTC